VIRQVRKLLKKFLSGIDDEKIDGFQVMYYCLLMLAGTYLAFGTTNQPPGVVITNPSSCAIANGDQVESIIGHPYYEMWLGLNIVCPILTLVGRHIGHKVAKKQEGEANAGVGAAWLRLCGDLGVWGAILIYVMCVVNTVWWGEGIYGAFFVLMGIPGGFMFSLRSVRRLQQHRTLERHIL
jgi:hypothetical protein